MTAWKRSWLRSLRKYWPMYLMLVPVIAYFLVFKYKPMLFVQIAFKDYKLRKGIWASEWVGLKHFMRFFSSYNFTTTLVFKYSAACRCCAASRSPSSWRFCSMSCAPTAPRSWFAPSPTHPISFPP